MEIREAIQRLADQDQEIYSLVCKVTAIDTTARTADVAPLNGDPVIYTVRLQATPSLADGLAIIPVVNSNVIVTFLDKTRAYISLFSEIEEIIINGGNLGGLINITPLTDKINTLENDLNTLKNVFTAWITVPNDGGAALKAGATTWAGQTITPTQTADIEDEKIKH